MPAERPSTAQDAAADDDAARRTSGIARFTPSFFTGSGGTRKSSITAAMLESAISSQEEGYLEEELEMRSASDSIVSVVIEDDDDDVAKRPAAKPCCAGGRRRLMRLIDSAPVQLSILVLILFDFGLMTAQLVNDSAGDAAQPDAAWWFPVTMAIVSVLMVEVLLRMFGLGFVIFFRHWSNTLDLVVSLLSLFLEVLVFELGKDTSASSAASNVAFIRVVRPIARVSRLCRVGLKAYAQKHKLKTVRRNSAAQFGAIL